MGSMKMLLRGAAATGAMILAVLLAGCTVVTAGEITAKDHRDAYTTTTLVCASYGKNGACTLWTPLVQQHPERWVFELTDEEGNSGTVSVTELPYEEREVGDYFESEAGA